MLWLLRACLRDLYHLFILTSQWVGHLPTKCEFYHWCCDLPLSSAGERKGEGTVERAWGEGSGGAAAQQARGVISGEAVMASLQQNRKHNETGLFKPIRARSTAQSTLALFSHPHILWIRALSAARLLCPHRRCHKKPSVPPNLPTTPASLILRETQRKSISSLCSVITLWFTTVGDREAHERHGMPNSF